MFLFVTSLVDSFSRSLIQNNCRPSCCINSGLPAHCELYVCRQRHSFVPVEKASDRPLPSICPVAVHLGANVLNRHTLCLAIYLPTYPQFKTGGCVWNLARETSSPILYHLSQIETLRKGKYKNESSRKGGVTGG